MWTFGLVATLPWYEWFLMLLGGLFFGGLGWGLGTGLAARILAR